MGLKSNISWTDHTINFFTGCKKLSSGCRNCYMYRDKERYGLDPSVVVKVADKTVNKVLKQAKAGDKIFTCSWSDFFIEEADQWRDWAWGIIRDNPQFIWQILTKRPERIKDCLPADWGKDGWQHVWLGVTIESDEYKDRLWQLHQLKHDNSKFKTFVSYEPAIGYLDLAYDDVITANEFERLDWVIVGGESGNDNGKYTYRPCKIEWIEYMVNCCKVKGIPVFVKQMGTALARELHLARRNGDVVSEFPEHLQIQQLPK